jgi:heme O synthase-like polyprenyltransferase
VNGIFATPRPVPHKRYPLMGGALVLALALVVFLLAGWALAGWALGAVLWVGVRCVDFLVERARGRKDTLAASGVLAFGLTFKAVAVLAVLLAVAVTRPHLAAAAAAVYLVAYTFELGLSLAAYFGSAR